MLLPTVNPGAEPVTWYPFNAAWLEGVLAALSHVSDFAFFDDVFTPEEREDTELRIVRQFLMGRAMVGVIFPYANSDVPTGALACDGSEYAREDYPALYAALDDVYIVDADNFVVPDLRGRVIVGTGQQTGATDYALDDSGGAEAHTLSSAEMPVHEHSYNTPTFVALGAPGEPMLVQTVDLPTATGSAGSGQAHENRPPYLALNFAIWAV